MTKPVVITEQVLVPAESATFTPIHNGLHYGSARCPFCGHLVALVGPTKGRGLVWSYDNCGHTLGPAAGAALDITVLFRGTTRERDAFHD